MMDPDRACLARPVDGQYGQLGSARVTVNVVWRTRMGGVGVGLSCELMSANNNPVGYDFAVTSTLAMSDLAVGTSIISWHPILPVLLASVQFYAVRHVLM